jgi:hypothetical protein
LAESSRYSGGTLHKVGIAESIGGPVRKPDPREEPISEPPRNADDDRPTVPPPFDMQAYAREKSAEHAESGRATAPPTRRYPSSGSALDEPLDMDISWSATSEPPVPNGAAREPDDQLAPRSSSPSSNERALLGFVEDPDAPVVTEHDMGDPTAYMLDRFAVGDYAGALDVAELILIDDPANRLASRCRNDCRAALEGAPTVERVRAQRAASSKSMGKRSDPSGSDR